MIFTTNNISYIHKTTFKAVATPKVYYKFLLVMIAELLSNVGDFIDNNIIQNPAVIKIGTQ